MHSLKEERTPVIMLGHILIYPLCLGFCAVPVWMYAVQQPMVAEWLGREVESVATCENATAL